VLPRRAKVNLMTRHKRLTALFLSAFFVTATAGLPLAALAPMASAAPRSATVAAAPAYVKDITLCLTNAHQRGSRSGRDGFRTGACGTGS
jgi:hypothetical protein